MLLLQTVMGLPAGARSIEIIGRAPSEQVERIGWFADSPLEGTGFEPSVPHVRRLFWALPIGDGGTKGGATYRFRSKTPMLAWSGCP
jgi:hypothetical protein